MKTECDSFYVLELFNGLTGKFEPCFDAVSGFVFRFDSEREVMRAVIRYYPWYFASRSFRAVHVP